MSFRQGWRVGEQHGFNQQSAFLSDRNRRPRGLHLGEMPTLLLPTSWPTAAEVKEFTSSMYNDPTERQNLVTKGLTGLGAEKARTRAACPR